MSFKWEDFIELAQYLLANPGNLEEAALRTVVSRAYYGVYHAALEYAQKDVNFVPQKSNQHMNLRSYFKTHKSPRIANLFDQLYKWRIECDYENKEITGLSQQVAPSSINRARNFLSQLY